MTSLLSQCLQTGLHHQSAQTCCRTALIHSSASVSKGQKLATRATIRGEGQQRRKGRQAADAGPPRPAFTRDEVPHVGKTPAPERGARIRPQERPRSGQQSYPRQRSNKPDRTQDSSHKPRPPLPYVSREAAGRSIIHDFSRRVETDTVPHGESWSDRKPIRSGAYDEPETQDEFYHPHQPASVINAKGKGKALPSDDSLPAAFTSPPLLPGFVGSLKEMLGPDAQPTPIQNLSMKWLLQNPAPVPGSPGWRQFLLASETGSGKSIAYLLPLLQNLKQAEIAEKDHPPTAPSNATQRPLNPRGIIMAPTHELARQLSGFAKSLLHEVKLRVLCASQANSKNTSRQKDATSSKMASRFQGVGGDSSGAFEIKKSAHPVSIVVGTPMKLLEMVRGRGWDRKEETEEKDEEGEVEDEENAKKPRRGRDKVVHFGKWRSQPELGLANVEWVVVDEADVLFDPDFQETTRTLLADISAARGHVLPPSASTLVPTPALNPPTAPTTPEPIDYPFNLVLTSATIPKSLNTYLEKHHPSLVRLASPRLHRLPKTLQTEYVNWTGGNKFADVMRRVRKIWAEDAASAGKGLSKVLIFCNRSAKVVEFSAYLAENGIKSVAMTSQSEHRGRGSNKHLEGFLRKRAADDEGEQVAPPAASVDVKEHPYVMVTTSLLSRGLDFSPEIKHVFIVDEPRNTIDFLHRAGRTGRAGERGKVVIFGKLKGRGSQRTKDVKKRIGVLAAA